jgi:membrane-bound lytic murein transglycosylase B
MERTSLHRRTGHRYRRSLSRTVRSGVAGSTLLLSLTLATDSQAEIYASAPIRSTQSGSTIVLTNIRSEQTPQTLVTEGDDAMTLVFEAPHEPRPVPQTSRPTRAAAPAQNPVAAPATPAWAVKPAGVKPIPEKLLPLLQKVAREYSLGTDLVAAVVATESGFNPGAISPRGAVGLMQLMPDTARRFGVRDIHAIEDNLRGGTAYLRWLLDRFAGNVALAVAAYNAGENRVINAGGRVPDIEETRRYVPKVLALRSIYASHRNVVRH